ncbi:MAG: hypothetical protein WBM74_04835 [Polyangiales bacterium]
MLRFRLLPALIGPFLAAVLFASPADGSIVQGLQLEELTEKAERIVLGRVLFSESFLHQNGQIWTWHRVAVEQEIRGRAPDEQELIIETLGGQIGDIGMRVEGEATFSVGERVLVFASGGGPYSAFRTVGMAQGVMRVRAERGVDTVHQSREGLMLVRRDAQGRLKRNFGALPEPERLDNFIARLKQIAAKQEAGR